MVYLSRYNVGKSQFHAAEYLLFTQVRIGLKVSLKVCQVRAFSRFMMAHCRLVTGQHII